MKRYIIVYIFLITGITVSGQRSYELSQPETTSKTYVARDFIRLLPGFSFNSTDGKTFSASINEHLLESAAYQTASQLPDPNRSLNQSYAVGATAGEASVSPTGAAVYQIPISVIPGTGGVQPSISIVYNSQSNNGLVGYGWNLSAVSAITRVGKTMYHDGSVAVPQLTTSDNLMLDGQRLMRASGTNLSASSTYKTEIESFLEITCKNFGSYTGFEVKNKEGWILEYGSTADSHIKPKDGSAAYAWLLKKATDANGNYMTYTYDNITASGEFRLKQIEYTGNAAAGLNPYNKVEFFYETRTDATNIYIAGKAVAQSVILKRIKCSASGVVIRDYLFNYYYDGFYSKLTEVEEYGQNGVRYNSTIVDWGDRSGYSSSEEQYLVHLSEDRQGNYPQFADFNGDGKTDFISYPDKSSYSSSDSATLYVAFDLFGSVGLSKMCRMPLISGFEGLLTVDLDGDGKMDIARISSVSGGYKYDYFLFDGSKFVNNNKGFTTNGKGGIVGDFNGDGKMEILVKETQKVFNENGAEIASGGIDWGSELIDFYPNNRYLSDFTGNGKTNLLIMNSSSSWIYELDGNTFSKLTSFSNSELKNTKFPLLGDFNGDGKTDILVQLASSKRIESILFSTGNEFIKQVIPDLNLRYNVDIGDFNGDGKTDIIHFEAEGNDIKVKIGLFDGKNFTIKTSDLFYLKYSDYNGTPMERRPFIWILNDFNGDGRTDFCFAGYINTYFMHHFANEQHLLVNSITNGLNQKVSFKYAPVTDTDYYAASSSAPTFPVANFQQPLYAVTTMTNQAGNSYSTDSYYYKGAKIHKQGKGFLGFEEIRTTNSQQNRKTTTYYGYNSSYYNVYPVKQTVTTTAGDSISRTDFQNTYFTSSTSKVIFPYLSSQTSTDKLTGLVRKTGYAYTSSDHGNPYKITETQGSLITETENTWAAKNSSFKNRITQQKITKKGLENTFTETKTFEYDAKARLTNQVDFSGNAKAVTTAYSNYDNFGNPQTVTTTAANCPTVSTSSTFDATGRFEITHTDALGKTSSARYDALTGLWMEKTDIAGVKTFHTYDGFQRLTRESTQADIVTYYSRAWDISGNNRYKIEANSSISGIQVTWYNAAGLETKSQSQGFSGTVIAEKEYNYKGQLYRSYLPGYGGKSTQYIEYAYDSYGRIQSETNIGRTTSYSYSGLTTTVTTPDGKTQSSTLNTSGLLASSTDAAGNSVTYTYNSLGKPATTTSNDLTTYINYDDRGFQRALKDANLTDSIQYVYDAYGQLTSQTNARGQTTSFQYDAAGRMTQQTRPESTLTYQYVSSGNGVGQLLSVKEGTKTVQSYTYTSLGLPANVTENVDDTNYASTYSYNIYGQITEKQTPSGLRVGYQYANGLLTSMKNAETGAYLWQADAVNALGQITESTLGNGLKRVSGYDTYHLPNQILLKNGSSVIDQVSYAFNSTTGNLTQRNDVSNSKNETFGYDNLNRLTSITLNSGSANSIAYNPNGNIQTKFDVGTHQYANGNHAVSNITNKASSYNPAAIDITHTSYNRASSIIQQGSVIKKLEFQYGADMQRNRSRYYENSVLQKTVYYLGNYEKEVVSGGSTKEYDYIRTPEGLSAIAVKTNGTRSLYYVQTDHLGSIRVVTTASKGIQTRYYYDAWGKQTPVSGTSITNRGYIGEEHLNDFGLINLNARLYDPVLARFMGMDPYVQAADFTQAYNRYAYGLNNPLCYVDANGELWWLIPVIAAAIFATGNTVAHAIRGDINNVGDFFKYFGQGALAGFALGAAWQFAPLIPYVGQGIQTVMTGYGYIQLGGAAVSTVSGLGQGIFTGDWSALENAGKIFAGNFYLDENRPFIDGVWQGFSRHTWEFIQTGLGHTVGQLRNTFDGVDNVDYFGGATLINVNDNSTTRMWGFTLGPFINSKNLDVNDEMFRHEYGHTLQSKRWGFLYPFVVGIPSALSSNFSSSEQHRNRWYEKDANRYGERYYRKYFRNSLTLTPWDDVRYPRR